MVKKFNLVRNQLEKERQKNFLRDQQTFLSTSASLANSQNKTLAAIGKASAITSIAIATPPAVAGSFRFGSELGGPALGFVFAGIAAAAMAAQAAAIAGVPLQTGLTEVPRGFPNDSFPARLTSGERVVNVAQNRDLMEFLDEQTSETGESQSSIQTSLLESIDTKLSNLQNQIVVNVGEREVINVIRDSLKSGRSLAV